MRALIVLVALLGACDKTKFVEHKSKLAIVPDAIADKLGNHNVVLAIDFSVLDLAKLKAFVPDEIGCVRDLIDGKGVLVAGLGDVYEAYITKLPEGATRACIERLAPLLGATTRSKAGSFEIEAGGDSYSMTWKDGVAWVHAVGKAPTGKLGEIQRAQIERVPHGAAGFVASGAFDTYKIKRAIVWLDDAPDIWRLNAFADGTEPDKVKPWLEGIARGFKAGAESKGLTVDDSWFTITGTPMTAKLEGKIPKSLFDPK